VGKRERLSAMKTMLADCFLETCRSIGISHPEVLLGFSNETVEHFKTRSTEEKPLQFLENAWYASLKIGSGDFDLYRVEAYLADVLACWNIYSKQYIAKLASRPEVCWVKRIADLGCGLGYTSLALSEIFNAHVYATNFKNSYQWAFAKQIGVDLYENTRDVGRVDLVFASEYFEHFQQPVKHLREVLRDCEPKLLCIANAFGAQSFGHFDIYEADDKIVSNKQIGRLFNAELRKSNYEQVATGWWNDRPSLWRLR